MLASPDSHHGAVRFDSIYLRIRLRTCLGVMKIVRLFLDLFSHVRNHVLGVLP